MVESEQVVEVLDKNIVVFHHIVSTAISRIFAKPIIGLFVEVKDIVQVGELNRTMELPNLGLCFF